MVNILDQVKVWGLTYLMDFLPNVWIIWFCLVMLVLQYYVISMYTVIMILFCGFRLKYLINYAGFGRL